MSETPTGTDRVELTNAEKGQIHVAVCQDHNQRDSARDSPSTHAAVESIVAARVHSENQRLLAVMDREMDKLQTACSQRDAARAEAEEWQDRWNEVRDERDQARSALFAANAEVARMKDIYRCHELGRLEAEAERDAARAELAATNTRCAELERDCTDLRELADASGMVESRAIVRAVARERERDALQETLDRVTAAINDHAEELINIQGVRCEIVHVADLRAALTPEGKP